MKNFLNVNALLGLIQGIIIAVFITLDDNDSIDKVLLVTATMSLWGALLFMQLSPRLMKIGGQSTKAAWMMLISYFAIFGFFGFCFLDDIKSSYQGTWGVIFVVVAYLILPFVQLASQGHSTFQSWVSDSYQSLFSHAWCNAILVVFGWLTALAVWLVLALWWELFQVIGIDFFEELFTNKWFAWPVLGGAFGIGIHAAHAHFKIIDNLKRLLLSMCGLLLPLVTLLTLSFVTSVAFTGLNNVWGTGVATPLILVLVFANILLINGASLPQESMLHLALPSNKAWRALVYINIVALTVLMFIAAYSSYLRIAQYGWTVPRVYLALTVVVMAFYTMPYLGLLRARARNFVWLKRTNVIATGCVVGLLVISHNPWFNPVSITIKSQLSRLNNQQVSVENFAYELLYFDLGQRGKDALADYVKSAQHSQHVALAKYYQALSSATDKYNWWDLKEGLTAKPYQYSWIGDSTLSDDEITTMIEASDFHQNTCRDKSCYFISFNVDYDDELEILLHEDGSDDLLVFDQHDGMWLRSGRIRVGYDKDKTMGIVDMFKQQLIVAKPTRYKALDIGGKLFEVRERFIPPSQNSSASTEARQRSSIDVEQTVSD